MRQLLVQVPQGQGREVFNIAKHHQGVNLVQLEAKSADGPVDVVIVHVSNGKVEPLLASLEPLPNLHITLIPRGVTTLKPPPSEAPEQVTDVKNLSPIEIFLQGLQSVGSWKGFLGYAATAGVVVWIGLFTNSSFLLVAAMLIAPFAGPAMNVAIATARGDRTLLWRSLVRYFAALGVTIAVTLLLSLVLGQEIATNAMIDNSEISAVSVLLPLAAGAAGALQLVQSERSSLVSGASIGMLVAASLAPPAGLVGMATALGRWDMVRSGGFLLLLQLVGINLAAATILRCYGLSARGARYSRGKKWMFPAVLAVTVAVLVGLLTWQFSSSPSLQRSSRSQRATAEIQQVVQESGLAQLIEANIRFTRSDIADQNTLLGVIYVQQRNDIDLSKEEVSDRLSSEIQTQLRREGFNVTPLLNITVFDPSDP
ncbi:MAG: DUF389 domain-containing protein [Cyanophyceae cyanobacterium]